MKRKFNKHSARGALNLPSRGSRVYKEAHATSISVAGCAGLMFALDVAVLGGFCSLTFLYIAGFTEWASTSMGKDQLERPTNWTTDTVNELSGTVQQKLAYRLAQDEIYRLNGLKTEANAGKVDKLLLKVKKDANKLLGDLAEQIEFLDKEPAYLKRKTRQMGKRMKV